MESFKWLWENLSGYRKRYVLCLALSVVMPFFMLVNPTLQKQLVDKVLVGGAKELLVPLLLIMAGITLLRSLLNYLSVVLVESASLGVMYNLRIKVYGHLQKMDLKFYDDNPAGDIMTVITSDIDMVRHSLVFVFRQIISGILLFVCASIYYLVMNWKFAVCMIALTPLIFVVSMMYRSKVKTIYKELRQRLSKLNTVAQENIEGNRVVKAFAREKYEIEKFNLKSDAFRDQNLHAQYIWLKYFPIIEGLSQSMTITTLLFGGIFMINGSLTPGEFIAFNSLSWAVTTPFQMLGQLFNDLQRFFASATKIMALLDTKPEIKNKPEAVSSSGERGTTAPGDIEFRNVSFSFGGVKVLRDISFHIKPGETYAIMGETGSGKTLIVNLISRFYDVQEGAVLVGGVDVRDWDLTELRRGIGMTTQEVFLFSDTVDSNIAYGDLSLSEEEVRRFAEISAADFIDELPHGYQTIIGERGVGLSGGQKQRIALARALAIRPKVLILDDTTSAVDLETEKYIQNQLEQLDFECTKIIIAQRISAVRKADCILLLEDGRIVERGSHEQLLAQRGRYYELWRIQTGVDDNDERLMKEMGVVF